MRKYMSSFSVRMAVLILGIFCVGTAELSPSGMLGELSRDLSITVPTAGMLVTVYALTVIAGGPFVTAITTQVQRKNLLVILLLVSVLGNVVCTFAPSFGVLLIGRMLVAIIQGTFMAVCVITASSMAAEGKQGSAVAGTQLGINLATVLGVPLGTLLAQQFHWRVTFGSVAVLAIVTSLLLLITIPRDEKPAFRTSTKYEFRVFANWQVIGTVLATVLCSSGMFALITYMVPLLTDVGGLPRSWVPVALLAYGIGSILGNLLGGWLVDRSLEATVVSLSWTLTAACVLYWLASSLVIGNVVSLIVFATVTFALIPGLQTRILVSAVQAPTLSLTINMAAFALGAAIGSWAGGLVITLELGIRTVPLTAGLFSGLGALLITLIVLKPVIPRNISYSSAPIHR